MKTRNILITIGISLMLLNILSYLGGRFNPPEKINEKLGYYIGRNLFCIAGIILLLLAYNKHKNLVKKKEKDMLDNFLN